MGSRQGRGVIDAVTDHSDYFPPGLQRLDQLQLLLRGNAGQDAGFLEGFVLLLWVQLFQLSAGEGPAGCYANLAGDVLCCSRVVAGGQEYFDAGLPYGSHGSGGLRA